MRIARYSTGAASDKVGVVIGDRIVDVAPTADRAFDIRAILQGGPQLWSKLSAQAQDLPGVPVESVRLLAPIPSPPKFLAIGWNTPSHVGEAEAEPDDSRPDLQHMKRANDLIRQAFPAPRFPLVFNKQTSCITGPSDPIWAPPDSSQLDYEGEAVIVIGRHIRRADPVQALGAIAGWTATNDVSVRDWQWDTSQMWLGKSFETHGPIGPWIVTADEFDPAAATIRTWVNGELRQEGPMAEQVRSPAQIVSAISQVCTLEAGDLIATGTPGGIGAVDGRYLTPGDFVRVEVSGIGAIENQVIAEPAAAVAD